MSVQIPSPESTPQPRIDVLELGAIAADMDTEQVERLAADLSERDPEFMRWLSRMAEAEEGSVETPRQAALRYGLIYGDYFYRQQETSGLEALLPTNAEAVESLPGDIASI